MVLPRRKPLSHAVTHTERSFSTIGRRGTSEGRE